MSLLLTYVDKKIKFSEKFRVDV